MADLIKTIEDDDDVNFVSGSSDSEDEAQPKKNRQERKAKTFFEPGFAFVSNQKEYMKDTWDDISKYVRRKAKTTLDEKIAQVRKERKREKEENSMGLEKEVTVSDSEDESEEEISDDELVSDAIKVKEGDAKRKQKRKSKNPVAEEGIEIKIDETNRESDEDETESGFFDDAPVYDEDASFYTMNLSRPLLKSIEELNFVHPTPIQAQSITIALSGQVS